MARASAGHDLRRLVGLSAAPTALVASLAGFIVLRFLMGLTECGNYTAGIKAIAGLFPGASRSTAGGVFNAGAQLGSVIAPLFVLALLRERSG